MGVGINDKDRKFRCIKQDGIGRLGADPLQLQQIFPEQVRREAEQQIQISLVSNPEESDERLEAVCLDVKKPGGANEVRQPEFRDSP